MKHFERKFEQKIGKIEEKEKVKEKKGNWCGDMICCRYAQKGVIADKRMES